MRGVRVFTSGPGTEVHEMNKRRRWKAKAKRAERAWRQHLESLGTGLLRICHNAQRYACLKQMTRADLKMPTRCRYHEARNL